MDLIKSCERPSFNMVGYVPAWLPIAVDFFNTFEPNVTKLLMEKVKTEKLWNFSICLLGPVGDIVEEWKIVDAKVQHVYFSSLDWSADPKDVSTIRVILEPKYAELV